MPALTEIEFRERRKTGIGGSDVAAVLGLSPWKTPYQLWQEKTGKVEEKTDPKKEWRFRVGHDLEESLAQRFMEDTGYKVEVRNTMYRHRGHDCLIANIDRYIVGQRSVLECKTTEPYLKKDWGNAGTDAVPQNYLLQVLHYMYVTGYSQEPAHLVVTFGFWDYRHYIIQYDRELAEFAAERCVEFWEKHVLKDIPPPATVHDDLDDIYHADPRKWSVATDEIEERCIELKEVKARKSEAEKREKQLKAEIELYMQDAEVLFSEDGRKLATWKKQRDTVGDVIEWEQIAREAVEEPRLAELIAKHTRYGVILRNGNKPLTLK